MRWVLLVTLAAWAIGTHSTGDPAKAPSLAGFNLEGAPWGIASEMPCAQARESLLKHGMAPLEFAAGAKRVVFERAGPNDPHPIDTGPGPFKSTPNVIRCSTRAAEWCDYAYARESDGRVFILQTQKHDESDCVVNRFFFAASDARSKLDRLEPRYLYGDWRHNIDLPTYVVQ